MKKLIASLLTLVMLFTLVACGGGSAAQANNTPSASGAASAPAGSEAEKTSTADEVYTIAFIAKSATSNWGMRQGEGVTKFNDEFGYEVIYDAPDSKDSAQQIALVETYMAQGVNAIIVVPFDVEAMEPTLKRAREQGIKVITHEASASKETDYDIEAVTSEDFGTFGMETIAEQVGDKAGTYVYMVGYFTNGSHNAWGDAAEARAAKFPNLTVAERVESTESFEGAQAKTMELIKAYPDLVAIQASSSGDLPGICNALEEANLIGKVAVGGLGIPSYMEQYFANESVKSCITWDPKNAAYAACMAAKLTLQGETISEGTNLGQGYDAVKVDGNVVIGSDINLITAENWASFGF
ncbi:substrate-binding domain-containing protein [Oscillospiraceae bacterium MB08-C2-2]|nr:substrate-binding domain-containing protein [Oscillospiraceae bacterium MB08-C2-2]